MLSPSFFHFHCILLPSFLHFLLHSLCSFTFALPTYFVRSKYESILYPCACPGIQLEAVQDSTLHHGAIWQRSASGTSLQPDILPPVLFPSMLLYGHTYLPPTENSRDNDMQLLQEKQNLPLLLQRESTLCFLFKGINATYISWLGVHHICPCFHANIYCFPSPLNNHFRSLFFFCLSTKDSGIYAKCWLVLAETMNYTPHNVITHLTFHTHSNICTFTLLIFGAFLSSCNNAHSLYKCWCSAEVKEWGDKTHSIPSSSGALSAPLCIPLSSPYCCADDPLSTDT